MPNSRPRSKFDMNDIRKELTLVRNYNMYSHAHAYDLRDKEGFEVG